MVAAAEVAARVAVAAVLRSGTKVRASVAKAEATEAVTADKAAVTVSERVCVRVHI